MADALFYLDSHIMYVNKKREFDRSISESVFNILCWFYSTFCGHIIRHVNWWNKMFTGLTVQKVIFDKHDVHESVATLPASEGLSKDIHFLT